MKKFLIVSLLLSLLVSCDCGNTNNENCQDIKPINTGVATYRDTGYMLTIDSCQYILSHVNGGSVIIHHSNCRFCRERRKEEIKEFVRLLKE